jgi:putative transcriptional regulator
VPRKKKSAASAVSREAKLTPVGKRVIEGLKEAIAHVRGEITLPKYRYPGRVDAKAIRAKSGLSQSVFAERYGFNLRTLQDWERDRVQPPSAVRAYLTVIDRFPETVETALLGAPAHGSDSPARI